MTDLPGTFFPAEPSQPGLVVLHEWWGLNAHIKDVARRFAAEGFNVFALDVYEGKQATDEAAASELMTNLDWGRALPLIGRALAGLKERAPKRKVGVTGFCMGGALSLAAAATHPFDACVPFYGIGPRLDVTTIRCKVLGHFAQRDGWCTPEQVDALEQKLKAAKARYELHRYEADHAFFNDTRKVYSPIHAKEAWDRTLTFLRAELT